MAGRHDEHVGRAISIPRPIVVDVTEQVKSIRDSESFGEVPAAARLGLVHVRFVADDDAMHRWHSVAQPGERLHEHRHALVRRQPADKQEQCLRLQP